MSELLPGFEPPPFVPAPTRDAAAVIVFRRVAGGAETFWIKRDKALSFAGGFYAFPGGKVDKADAAIPVAGAKGVDAALRVTAARELLEETGLLVAVGAERTSAEDRAAMRRALLEKKAGFAELLAERGLTLDAAHFPDAGRWVTPPHLPGRFDARFFLVEAPVGQGAEVWPGELSFGAWTAPEAALAQWRAGTALLHPPNRHALEVLRGLRDVPSALAALRHPPHCVDFIAGRIEFQQGVLVVPLRTPTLPPATHTNTYVLGTKELLVVDPGSPDPAETAQLIALLEALRSEGAVLRAVVPTHHHGDHVGGLEQVVKALGLPVWAHPRTADRLPVPTARLLTEGDVLSLAGGERWVVRHTPGHAQGHVCLVDERSRAMVVGDMVAGTGTIVIDPPEGDMAQYLAQLERLRALGPTTLYPAHGAPSPDGAAKLTEYLQHRAWREGKVRAALSAGPGTLEALVPRAYDDVQAFVWPLAERSTLAILQKLEAEGLAARSGETWRAVSPG